MNRRKLLKLAAGAGALTALGLGARNGLPRLARPAKAESPLSPEALKLLEKAWVGLDPARVLDCHAHLVGLGTGGTGAFANDRMRQLFSHPIQYARFRIYLGAAGVTDLDRTDQQYLETLTSHVRSQRRHGRIVLLPFDEVVHEDGTVDHEASEIHTPNDYVQRVVRERPDCFVAATSIHPYRKDALALLEKAHADGAVLVKWLPNAQHIDPSSPRCDAFYDRLAALGMPLLSHAGEERAVTSAAQAFGNPLLLRRPLDHGVKVIVAHCASFGESPDLEAPGTPLVEDFQLFLRLADDPKYRDLLYGDISAITQSNRCQIVARLLERQDLHSRLVYGTDYPLASINALVRTSVLVERGLLTENERGLLNEIDTHNPLAFDLACKRTLAIQRDGRTLRFADDIFHARAELFPNLA